MDKKNKNKVLLKINGQEYPIVGVESKEYLLKVGSYVDEKMEQVSKYNTRLSTSMIAVLTCINIADQFFKFRNEFEKTAVSSLSLNETDKIKDDLKSLQNEIEERKDSVIEMQKQIEELAAQKEEAVQENMELKQLISEKEEDLKKYESINNELQNKLFESQIKLVQSQKQLEEYISNNDKIN